MRLLAVLVLLALAAGCSDGPAESESEEGPLDTIFVGDSITRGVSQESMEPDAAASWVTYAVEDAGSPWRLEDNVAVFGRTLAEMLAGFGGEVLDARPDAVVIMGGTNDVLRGLPAEESVEALRVMVERAQEQGIRVWVVSPPPVDPGYQRSVAPLVAAQAELAEELDVPFVDLDAALGGAWEPGLSFDGVHPTEEGARRIAEVVLEAVQ